MTNPKTIPVLFDKISEVKMFTLEISISPDSAPPGTGTSPNLVKKL